MTTTRTDTRALRRERAMDLVEWLGIALVAILLFVLFSVLSPQFNSHNNLMNIVKQVSIVAVLSIGMSCVFLIGGMDLSAGSNMFLSAVLLAVLLEDNVNVWVAMLIAIAACTITGTISGLIIERLKINCVIVTLGSQLLIRGIALVIIEKYNSWIYVKNPVTRYINTGKPFLELPTLLFVIVVLYIIAYFLLHRTSFGRQVYAVGGNPAPRHCAAFTTCASRCCATPSAASRRRSPALSPPAGWAWSIRP